MPRRDAEEFFYEEDGAKKDAELHDPIIADGDHAAAHEVSRAVMKRLGLSDARINALLKPKT
jgi:hypothetical protein